MKSYHKTQKGYTNTTIFYAICEWRHWHLAAIAMIGYEVIFQWLRRFLAAYFARHFTPFRPVEFREPCISDHILMNRGYVEPIRQVQRLRVNIRTTNHEYLRVGCAVRNRFRQ